MYRRIFGPLLQHFFNVFGYLVNLPFLPNLMRGTVVEKPSVVAEK